MSKNDMIRHWQLIIKEEIEFIKDIDDGTTAPADGQTIDSGPARRKFHEASLANARAALVNLGVPS